jgi:hypothetical protein
VKASASSSRKMAEGLGLLLGAVVISFDPPSLRAVRQSAVAAHRDLLPTALLACFFGLASAALRGLSKNLGARAPNDRHP